MNIFTIGITTLLAVFPYTIFAATAKTPTSFASLVNIVIEILGTLVVVVFSLTFLVFVWGIIKNWVLKGGSAEGAENGKKVAVAAIVAFVIMVSVWGILSLLQNSIFGQ